MTVKLLLVPGALALAFFAGQNSLSQNGNAPAASPLQSWTFHSPNGDCVVTLLSEVIGGVPGEAKPRRITLFEAHFDKQLEWLNSSYVRIAGDQPEPLPPAFRVESGSGTFVIAPKSGDWKHVIQQTDLIMTFLPSSPAPAPQAKE
jgi:hypothetical protein